MHPVRILFIIATSVFLSACLSTPFEFVSKEDSSIALKNSMAEQESETEKKSDAMELQKIKEYAQELEVMWPQLVKIIAMEQDLSFMIDQLASVTSLENKALFIQDNNERKPELSGLEATNNEFSSDAFLSASRVKNNKPTNFLSGDVLIPDVQVAAAPRLTRFSETNADGNIRRSRGLPNRAAGLAEDVSNSKFSQTNASGNLQASLNLPNRESDLLGGVADSKFSQASVIQKKIAVEEHTIPVNTQYGLHLVSVSKKANLSSFWSSTLIKHPDVLANKKPLVDIVIVNGKQFFSLRVGPYSENVASNECNKLTAVGTYCGVVTFQGEPLQL